MVPTSQPRPEQHTKAPGSPAEAKPQGRKGRTAHLAGLTTEQGQSIPYLQLPQNLIHEVSRVLFVSHSQSDGIVEELVGRTRPVTHRMEHWVSVADGDCSHTPREKSPLQLSIATSISHGDEMMDHFLLSVPTAAPVSLGCQGPHGHQVQRSNAHLTFTTLVPSAADTK